MKVMVYYAGWSIYREPKGFNVKDLDVSNISQINYAFILLNSDGHLGYSDKEADIGNDGKGGNLGQLKDLKKKFSNLKILMSIGGWDGSKNFSIVARTPSKRTIFLSDISKFIKKHEFDGVDIDWEYPTPEGGLIPGHKDDPQAFLDLMTEIRKTIGHDLILSAALPATPIPLIGKVAPLLDYVMLMTYDFTGATYSDKAYHHANLYGSERRKSVSSSVGAYMNLGVSPSQIILGVPAYGKKFYSRGLNEINEKKNQEKVKKKEEKEKEKSETEGGGDEDEDSISYSILCKDENQLWDPIAKAAYIEKKEKEFISFDNDVAIAEKTMFALSKGLGGMFIWEASQDLPSKDNRSIVNTIKRVARLANS